MGALRYVHVPNYAALLLRRTYADLSLPGAIMDRSKEWWMDTGAKWHDQDKTWVFPNGSTITFGYLQNEDDKYRYQSSEFQYIGFDELTQFTITQYLYLFSRLRRRKGVEVPLRMRAGSNPGGSGHDWVFSRFIAEGAVASFVPAHLEDNPGLDQAEYIASLDKLDPVTRDQLKHGDWLIKPQGPIFKREDFRIVHPTEGARVKTWYRSWDTAATKKKSGSASSGALIGIKDDGTLVIADVKRFWKEYPDLRAEVIKIARDDGPTVPIGIEFKSTGQALFPDLQRELLGHPIYSLQVSTNKRANAGPWAARGRAGNLELLAGSWNNDFINECVPFTGEDGEENDQVDAVSRAFQLLVYLKGEPTIAAKPLSNDTWEYFDRLSELNQEREVEDD